MPAEEMGLGSPAVSPAAINLADAAYKDVAFIDDRKDLVSDADVVLAVQPPALDVINAMKEGAIPISFIYANKEKALLKHLLNKKITTRMPGLRPEAASETFCSNCAHITFSFFFRRITAWPRGPIPTASQGWLDSGRAAAFRRKVLWLLR
jgi:hypothetical protein